MLKQNVCAWRKSDAHAKRKNESAQRKRPGCERKKRRDLLPKPKRVAKRKRKLRDAVLKKRLPLYP